MIKFFRHIRKALIEKNQMGKYFKYAIGEILLVVIGILIALAINNWNQNRLSGKQELNYLKNLKEELVNNLNQLKTIDSIYSFHETDNAKGITLFKNSTSIHQFKTIDSLVQTMWMTFQVTSSTYNEMITNGSFYSLRNKTLKNEIDEHYSLSKRYESAFKEMNSNGQAIAYNTDIYPLEVLLDRLNERPSNLNGIDTSWIHNPNSKIYIGFFKKAKFFLSSGETRKRLAKKFSNSCNGLIEQIEKELRHYD